MTRAHTPRRYASLAAALLLLPLAACAAAGAAAPQRHVVLIIVDGLRPDAPVAAGARHIAGLAARGASTTARVDMPRTLPSLMTLVTGVGASRHGVTWNDDQGREVAAPTLFTQARDAGLRTALYFGKSKLAILAPRGSATISFGPGKGTHDERGRIGAVAERFAADFPRERPALAFVHLREPDGTGHKHGWMSPRYLAAVRAADEAVGTVVRAIETSGVAGSTVILLTADHGGEGTTHGPNLTEASWWVPLICVVPGRPPGRIDGPVTLADVAPTLLAWLGLPPLPKVQGRAIEACLPKTP